MFAGRSFSDNRGIKYRMIQINLKNTRVCFDFTFFAVIAFFMLTDGGVFGFSAIIACALHEMSHLIIMIIFSIPVDNITFYGAGIRITSDKIERAPRFKRNIVLFAGSAGNFIFAVILWISGETVAALINLFTGVFNLLPIGDYDGAALLKGFVIRHCKAENVDIIMKAAAIISAVSSILFMIFFGGDVSFTLLTTIVYLLASFGLKK